MRALRILAIGIGAMIVIPLGLAILTAISLAGAAAETCRDIRKIRTGRGNVSKERT